MPWWYTVAEHDHTIQNPTSEAKIRLLGERLRLLGWAIFIGRERARSGRAS
jgi:hypothetical protein